MTSAASPYSPSRKPCDCGRPASEPAPAPLTAEVRSELVRGFTPASGPVQAIVVPHGDDPPAELIAARILGSLANRRFDRVVAIGPSRRGGITLPAVLPQARSLGGMKLDRRALSLLAQYPGLQIGDALLPESLLGWLAHLWPEAQLVPLAVGNASEAELAQAGRTVRNVLDEDTLALATVNWGPRAGPATERALERLRERSEDALPALARISGTPTCGAQAAAVLAAALGPGCAGERIDRQAEKGDAGASAGNEGPLGLQLPGRFPSVPALAAEDRLQLASLAARAVAAAARGDAPPEPGALSPRLASRGGAFVTLTQRGSLRGCMGQLDAESLASAVVRAGTLAARGDPRFRRLDEQAVGTVAIEVSVLGPFKPVRDAEDFELGRHGLLLTRGMHRGLLLPQVATHHGMSREEFVEALAQKAGLLPGEWRDARIERFGVEAFFAQADA